MTLPRSGSSNRMPLFGAPPSGSPVRQKLDDQFYREFSRAVELAKADIRLRDASAHSHFNPNQPRVSAGHSDGGQWTSAGRGSAPSDSVDGFPVNRLSDRRVMSDEDFDPPRVWSQYAQVGTPRTSDLATIERIQGILSDTLLSVNKRVSARVRGTSVAPWLYGINVHTEFAHAVRALDLPGIGRAGVEQSFDINGKIARYGLDGTIRTDVVLRNRNNDIIAIFDVKTGNAIMEPATEARYRLQTKVGPEVPIFILHAVRGLGLY